MTDRNLIPNEAPIFRSFRQDHEQPSQLSGFAIKIMKADTARISEAAPEVQSPDPSPNSPGGAKGFFMRLWHRKKRKNKKRTSSQKIIEKSVAIFSSSANKDKAQIGILPSDFDAEELERKTKKNKSALRRLWARTAAVQISNSDSITTAFRMPVIQTSNAYYQVWKVLNIALCFFSSFYYVFQATFSEAGLHMIEVCLEVLFLGDVVVNFFTEHHLSLSNEVEQRVSKISLIYLRGKFWIDALALLPLFYVLLEFIEVRYARLAYLFKLVRLEKGFALLNHKNYMKQIKAYYGSRIQKIIQADPTKANSSDEDNNFISAIIRFSRIVNLLHLTLVLLFGSYFVGLLWFIICNFQKQASWSSLDQQDTFIETFQLESKCIQDQAITLVYFAFTSLSTVGLGDLHPRSNLERGIGAFVLLFGVAMTSLVMENLTSMLKQFQESQEAFDEEDQLSLFFGTLERFNQDMKMNPVFVHQCERYFHYRWHCNKLNALTSVADQSLMEQLPDRIQNKIFLDFLFRDVLSTYRRYFAIISRQLSVLKARRNARRKFDHRSQAMVTMPTGRECIDSEQVERFQILLCRHLEPILYKCRQTIQQQGFEASQMSFFLNGEVDVGYHNDIFLKEQGFFQTQNMRKNLANQSLRLPSFTQHELEAQKKKLKFRFPVSLNPGFIVGIFELTFHKTASHIYKASKKNSSMHAFFIRRSKMRRIFQEPSLQEISKKFKRFILLDYINKIYLPIERFKEKMIDYENEKKLQKANPTLWNLTRNGMKGQLTWNKLFGRFSKQATSQSSTDFVLGKKVETELKRKETNLMLALTWKDEVKDEGLRHLIHVHLEQGSDKKKLETSRSYPSSMESSSDETSLSEQWRGEKASEASDDEEVNPFEKLWNKLEKVDSNFRDLELAIDRFKSANAILKEELSQERRAHQDLKERYKQQTAHCNELEERLQRLESNLEIDRYDSNSFSQKRMKGYKHRLFCNYKVKPDLAISRADDSQSKLSSGMDQLNELAMIASSDVLDVPDLTTTKMHSVDRICALRKESGPMRGDSLLQDVPDDPPPTNRALYRGEGLVRSERTRREIDIPSLKNQKNLTPQSNHTLAQPKFRRWGFLLKNLNSAAMAFQSDNLNLKEKTLGQNPSVDQPSIFKKKAWEDI